MRAALLAFALMALAGAARADIPGLSRMLDRPGLRYLVIGEMHGTEEMPAFFGDLAAEAAAKRPVAVVLEYPERFGRDLQTYLASSGDQAARAALLSTDFWTKWHDGRSSRAMFALIEKLRALQVPVFACQPTGSAGDAGGYERVMGECWKQAAEASKRLTLILVGNAHASYMPVFGDTLPAAAHLPREETVSLDNLFSPGWSWHCEKVDKCGEYPSHGDDDPKARGIYPGQEIPEKLGTFDGAYSVGPRFTASPPAAN
jgi:hypothetical protein